ncbi:MAG: hypothetical protein BV456_01000 [Thermoplasmata archaeon M8B2D]|nr:MAG: hypothetical protein BV456_01000 [Thermoplasmata archaeon M8B2D]
MDLKDEKITIAVNGQQYEDFVSASVSKSLVEVSGGFAFQMTDRSDDGIPFESDDEVEIFIDGEKVITGYIMEENAEVGQNLSSISITGKEKTIDFVDSELTSNIDFGSSSSALETQYLNDLPNQPVLEGNFDLVEIIKKALRNINLDIDVKLQDGLILNKFSQEENVIGKVGEKAFKFCEELARKRNVVITTDENGDILIQKATNIYNNAILQLIIGNETNNILSSNYKRDFRKRFYKYTARSSKNLGLGSFGDNSTNRVVVVYNNQIRSSRQREIVMDANSLSTMRKRLIWQKNFDLNNDTYFCKVQGFRDNTGELWYPNTLVEVNDEKWNIKKRMLIKSCNWEFSNSGTFTNMILVDPIAFSDAEDYRYDFKINEIIR